MTKKYLLKEKHTIGEYKSKKEAEADRDNNSIWYPENDFEVVAMED